MIKRNRFLAAVPALMLAIAASACDDGLTDINQNPNAPEDVPLGNVLLGGIWDVAANGPARGFFGQWTMMYCGENWAQHVAQPIYNDEDRYTPRTGIPTAIWDEMYAGALQDLLWVKEQAEEAGDDNMWAVAEIMSVLGFQLLTDYFGDIPYSEALALDQDNVFPAYDLQSEIYPDLIERLQAAASRINTAESVSFAAYDPMYHGDMEGWKKFANSLRLRLALRMANVSASAARQAFVSAWSAGVMSDVGDAADIEWSSAQPAQNPLYEGITLAGRTGDFRLSSSLVDRLAALNDPRLPIYADPAVTDGAYRGLRNGSTPAEYEFDGRTGGASDFSTIGSYFLQPTTPSTFMSYADVLFAGAEAAARGWIGGSPSALYSQAVAASMEVLGIAQTDIDAYLAQPAVAYGGMEDIWLQHWISLYLAGPEAFAEMRRVGWMDLQPADHSVLPDGAFPARLYYPPEENLYNHENYLAAGGDIPITTPLWWMGH